MARRDRRGGRAARRLHRRDDRGSERARNAPRRAARRGVERAARGRMDGGGRRAPTRPPRDRSASRRASGRASPQRVRAARRARARRRMRCVRGGDARRRRSRAAEQLGLDDVPHGARCALAGERVRSPLPDRVSDAALHAAVRGLRDRDDAVARGERSLGEHRAMGRVRRGGARGIARRRAGS